MHTPYVCSQTPKKIEVHTTILGIHVPRERSHYRIKTFKKVHYMEVYKFILIQPGKTTQYIGLHDG